RKGRGGRRAGRRHELHGKPLLRVFLTAFFAIKRRVPLPQYGNVDEQGNHHRKPHEFGGKRGGRPDRLFDWVVHRLQIGKIAAR
ncbi:MAG: hypothetical protein WCR74_20530, partial [Betaproteobacteria bacterium]